MKELKINVPDGYEIDKEKSTFENIVFKKKSQLPTRWSEKDYKGYTQYEAHCYNEIGIEFRYKTLGQARASVALAKLSQLRDVYRQGWEPDWNDIDTQKWVINIHHSDIRVSFCYATNTFLSFQDGETAMLFRDNFRSLIEEAKPLMS
jgi:hypothetical protein